MVELSIILVEVAQGGRADGVYRGAGERVKEEIEIETRDREGRVEQGSGGNRDREER